MRGALAFVGILFALALPAAAADSPVDFNRDVRPILSQHCFKCHGPDDGKREAGVRLDLRESAVAKAESGAAIIVPGQPNASELVRRVESADPDLVMPPPSTNHTLNPQQKRILREWVASGAEYQLHWAYVAPRRPTVPDVKQSSWARNPVDRFTLAAMERAGLWPSPEADRYTLVRRVSLDLLGLPPTVEEAEEFARDPDPNAYEKLVDRLLASPHYGERWARRWLDLARYADTNGYEKDRPRTMWPYRDWVIGALNADLPFDRFTIEQFAGDMLPQATTEQRIATGFHRNTMTNEEGGIDPLEYRFHSLTDRLGTTGTAWMGLTVACAQCHTHKYDPIQHTDYYRLLAFLNNADEPELDVPNAAVEARRQTLETEIAAREADLPQQFPLPEAWKWRTPPVLATRAAEGVTLSVAEDGVVLASGELPDKDRYAITVDCPPGEYGALRVETLTDPSLGGMGPGRTPHGNFVITEVTVAQEIAAGETQPVKLAAATADFAQDQFPPANVLDGKQKTGWAIHGVGQWNVPRTLTITFAEPLRVATATRYIVRLDQQYGGNHLLGKFRLQLGEAQGGSASTDERRRAALEARFQEWLTRTASQAVSWTPIVPQSWTTTLPKLELLPDGSLLASGDQAKRDIYELVFGPELSGATAIRVETLPDDRLPKHGPGRVYYEGPFGDFFLSEIQWDAGEQRLPWSAAAHSFANANNTAASAIDGQPLSGWAINGGQGQPHVAVFQLADAAPSANRHTLRMIFERYYAAGLGRFRISYTTAPRAKDAPALLPELESLLALSTEQRTAEQQQALLLAFCRVAPELETARQAIQKLKGQLPALTTTLVFQERPADNLRPTRVYRRGEFLQPQETVEPGVPAFLPQPRGNDRLAFAEWLVDPRHPLVGRVTVNRHWQAFFGRGLVRTMEDFGYQGELPTHPELLDWLAIELIHRGWSIKDLHRQLVTSATYRQSSHVSPLLAERDPTNRWLARGPRVRLEAEHVRDALLQISGLLSTKLYGPSVFPPQPANVTTEGAYGQLAWTVSPGEDRYRRGLYTFSKRTAPYAMFSTFDAPSGEACVPRREVSNTPLQALTLLNDATFVESAQALGREWAARPGDVLTNLRELFQRCLTRPPSDGELSQLLAFQDRQRARLTAKELDAEKLAGPGEGDAVARAVWTITARALLNLDETITKE
jgi:mono/diheme cytochrome c family protein